MFHNPTTTNSSITTTSTTVPVNTTGNPAIPQLTSSSEQNLESAPPPSVAARSSLLLQLPEELLFKVFTDLPVRFSFRHSLRSFATTARRPNQLAEQFLQTESGQAHAQSFKAGPYKEWSTVGVSLRKDVSIFRRAFVDSAAAIGAGVGPLDISAYSGLGINFKRAAPAAPLQAQLFQMCDKPIKLMAAGIGRERFLNEVLPLLAGIDDSCPLILDASANGLDAEALARLLIQARSKRNLYSIDLSDNPLVSGEEACQPLVKLLEMVSPLMDLYLRATACNEATALALATALERHRFLRQIDLRDNQIKLQGTLALLNAVQQGQRFKHVEFQALRLQGNPASRACSTALDYARGKLYRYAVCAGQALPTDWRGYAHMGPYEALLRAVDRANGRGNQRLSHIVPVITIGAANDQEDIADKRARSHSL